MRKELFKIRQLSLAALCSIAIALASCSSEENVQGGNKGPENGEDKNLTTFMAGAPESRTSMNPATGAFFWEAGDYIYVQDDDNVWQKSSNAPTAKTASYKFYVPGKFEAKSSYRVYYPGKNGAKNEVTIPAAQAQTEPNSTAHFGVSGDCASALATKAAGEARFSFTLDHQAAILYFQPYTTNIVLKNCYLTKIEVNSDDDITDTYTLDPVSGKITGSGTGKQITLTTKNPAPGSANEKGFPLTNTTANPAVNGAYMFIKPGTHKLKVRYWVKDYVSNVEGTITKEFSSFFYDKNIYYDMLYDLQVPVYENKYYMWDAQHDVWYGYYQYQPTYDGAPAGEHYPQSEAADPDRWYNTAYNPTVAINASHSCKDCPNANQMIWYCMKGAPHWDEQSLWGVMGHLHTGGMWFKKAQKIADDEGTNLTAMKNGYPDPNTGVMTDWRTKKISDPGFPTMPQVDYPSNTTYGFANNTINPVSTLASTADYFFLPLSGAFGIWGGMTPGSFVSKFMAGYGNYWSSNNIPSTGPTNSAVALDFSKTSITINFSGGTMAARYVEPQLFK